MTEKTTQTLLFALLLCVGAMMYLDWRRQGELDLLHERLDNLNLSMRGGAPPAPVPASAPPAPAAAPAPVTPAAPAPPAPAPERAYTGPVVISDPVPGEHGHIPAPAPTANEIHPLLRSVMQAHTEGA